MLRNALRRLKYTRSRSLYWSRTDVPNWGDDLNPWLFEKITGRAALYCPHRGVPRLLMAGSILEQAGSFDHCWGTGLISSTDSERCGLAIAHAVRGPRTAIALDKAGLPSSDVFGDPGLLVARFVTIPTEKKHAVGVIPHYADLAHGVLLAKEINASLIPVSLGIEDFVKAVAEAEVIYSSSLHGIICAESLGIPAVWVIFSDNLIGGEFKFRDYIDGTGRDADKVVSLDLRSVSARSAILDAHRLPMFDVEAVRQRLLNCFPLGLSREAQSTSRMSG